MSKLSWKEFIGGVVVGSIGTELKTRYLKRRPDVKDHLEGVPSKVKELPIKIEETMKPIVKNLEMPTILSEAKKALKPAVDNTTESPGTDGHFTTDESPGTDSQFSTNESPL